MKRSARPAPSESVAFRSASSASFGGQDDGALEGGSDDLFPAGVLRAAREASSRSFIRRSQASSGTSVFRKVIQPVETRQVDRLFLRAGQRLPDLFGGERKDGRGQGRERAADPGHGGLGGPALPGGGGRGVEPVLQDVEIEGRERRRAEVDERSGRRRGTRSARTPRDARREPPSLRQRPAVERQEVRPARPPSRRGIEVVEVGDQVARRVPDLAVRLGAAGEDLLGDRVVVPVVGARHPQPQDVRAVLLDEVPRLDDVADRLRHLPAGRPSTHEAVRDDAAIGSVAVERDRGEQRRLEPAAVLVVPLDVEVRGDLALGRAELGPLAVPQDGGVRDTRVEPDVEDVGLLHESSRANPRRSAPGGRKSAARPRVPGVRPLLAEDRDDVVEELLPAPPASPLQGYTRARSPSRIA